jgi:hypothetical protein
MNRLTYLELKVQEALDEMRKKAKYDNKGNLVHYQPRHKRKLREYVKLRTEAVMSLKKENV